MRSEEEVRNALELYRENRDEPDPKANQERRRALLWVLEEDWMSADEEEVECEWCGERPAKTQIYGDRVCGECADEELQVRDS